MYLSFISSKLTHGLRKRFPYKKLTQPYARAGFAYALLRYDNTLIKHEDGGLSNGSLGRTSGIPYFRPLHLPGPRVAEPSSDTDHLLGTSSLY